MMHSQPGSMSVLDAQTFVASALATDEGLTVALRVLESCLAEPDIPLDLIVQDLCSIPHLFEFILSVLPSAKKLVHRILDAYPHDPFLLQTSSAHTLILTLSSTLFALPPHIFPSDIVRRIGQYKVYVEDALPLLCSLRCADFSFCDVVPEVTSIAVVEEGECGDEEFSGFFTQKKKQKKLKRKNRNNTYTLDVSPFHKLGLKAPSTNVEASQIAHEVAEDLEMILKFYLELLQEQRLAQPLKNMYIPIHNEIAVYPIPQCSTKAIEPVEPKSSAYPKVQPMKAALYFENADGFGEWRIIIGTDATKKLRELASSDRKKCAIVIKKIKQLSNGHFSDENQKRLNGSAGIPIFEAKMQRDLRLVYQIDVVPDHDGEVERQVIKIYGIYTHTQLDRIWDAIGQHLAGKGKEYRRRCIFRNRPVHTGSEMYLPASFPPECYHSDTKPASFVLSDEDMGELHSILVLEKYITFSQAFLHSLITSQDVQHVFELTMQERRIVECTTSCYVLGRSGTGKTTTMLFKMLGIQRAWEMQMSEMPKPRQIFVTKSSVLASKVEEYFTKLLESLALAGYSLEELKRLQVCNRESGLVDQDDIERVDIPQRYSALEETHFPLFVTFDKLARMIAADVLSGDDPEVQRTAKFFVNTDGADSQDSLVTYEVFSRTYWPHFPQPLTKSLEPWLVFSEFIGIIKGSEKSLSCPNGFLDEETYCHLPARSNPTFANERQTVYAIFEAYCRIKKERRHYDVADRTHAILRALITGIPLEGQRVDYLYIDEAQDNLLIDALLLRSICRNPEGLFWAGDTAQTISAGSSFRFNDLKAFLYRIEQDYSKHLIEDRTVNDPAAFQLAINYRSHGGIVNCAHSVIERIMHFWPDAIDGLKQEHGIVDGFKPVFFHGWDQDTVRYEQFLFGESGSRIEFGAQQCILVRNEEAVQRLQKEVGKIGLIMTLYDSKGLEFNDVLLYNFFDDSAVDVSRWRVLLNHADGEAGDQDLDKLKLLYVGITRARKNLWIFDKSDKSEPMRMIWTARKQVENCTPGTDVPRLAVSSTPEEWESFGNDLFIHKRYPQAKHCFSRAEQPRMVAICEAFHLREVARSKVGVAPPKVQQEAFATAADAFMATGNDAPSGKNKLQYYRNAAECFMRAGDHQKAAAGYLSAQDYDRAARHFRKAGLFNETLEILHNYSLKIPPESLEELYTTCRLFYCSKRDIDIPHLLLFSSFKEELEFLREYDLDFAQVALLETHEKYSEAAELHLLENRPLDAIRDFLKEKGSLEAAKKAAKIILDGLWRRCSFAVSPKTVAADQDVSELLNLAHELPPESLNPSVRDEISMFRAIAQADMDSLKKLSVELLKDETKGAAALLTLDRIFSQLPVLKNWKLQEVSDFLVEFRHYSRLLHQIISHPDPLGDTAIKQLFCIREISDTDYVVEPKSFLHSWAMNDHHSRIYLRHSLPKQDVVMALRKCLTERLRGRVAAEHELCYQAVVFSPCLTYTVTRQCNRHECPLDHVDLASLDEKYYNTRVGIHLQQMCILQYVYSADPVSKTMTERKDSILDWLVHLYEALNPEFHVQGSMANLDLSLMPGANECKGVIKRWVWEALHFLPVIYDPRGFLTAVLKLTSLLYAFDRPNALKCINQAPVATSNLKLRELIYPDGSYAFEDIVKLIDGDHQASISSGLQFLRHVLDSTQSLNLSVFCDFLEDVIGKISVSWRLSFIPPLDGLVLPRAWFSNKDFSKRKDIKITLLLELLDRVQGLLVFLQSGSASDKFTLSDAKLTPILCNIFISRICRASCLLAHNIRNRDVILKVKNVLKALQATGPTQTAHFFYRKYTSANQNEYLKVMESYDDGVVIQDLVRLLHKKRKGQRPLPLRRITNIEYENPLDIPSLVVPRLVTARSTLRVGAPVFVPHGVQAPQPEAVEELCVDEHVPEAEPTEEVYEEQPDLPPPVMDEPALIRAHEHTDRELKAAVTIQVAYRTYRNHREAQARAFGKGLKARRNTAFVVCLRNIYTFGWQKSPYRTLYLWALPSLLVCLDKVVDAGKEFRRKTRGLLIKESHERLEEAGKQMSTIQALLKESHELHQAIDPDSAMHQEKDEAEMKKAVLRVKDLTHQLPISIPQEIKDDFDAAYRLVMVTGEQRRLKPEKPTLNTEDLYDDF